jgi:hypothetical protein
MPSSLHRTVRCYHGRRVALRRRSAAALFTASVALLVVLPSAAARASAGTGGSPRAATTRASTAGSGELLSVSQLDALLAGLPLGDLSAAQLAHQLATLEGVSALAGLHVGLLGGEELGATELEAGLRQGIEGLGASATLGELADTGKLLPEVEAKLDGLLTSLLGSALGVPEKQGLSEALANLDLDRLVSALLGSAKEPAQLGGLSDLADSLMQALGTGGVEGLLGAPLTSGFAASTVENAAAELGSAPETVSSELGQTAAQLPATATMLTAPVMGGKLLAIAPAVKGLAIGLLGGAGEEGGAGKSETGSGSGSGEDKEGKTTGGNGSGQGAPGAGTGGGSGGSAGGLTLVVNLPSAQSAVATTANAVRGTKSRKIAILRAQTKGAVATIVLQAPAAGRLTLRGHGVRSSTRAVASARRVTLKVRLSRDGVASLRRRHTPLKIRLDASFEGAAGASSKATTTLTFG